MLAALFLGERVDMSIQLIEVLALLRQLGLDVTELLQLPLSHVHVLLRGLLLRPGIARLGSRRAGSSNVALTHSDGCNGKRAVEGGSAGAEEGAGGLSEVEHGEVCRDERRW